MPRPSALALTTLLACLCVATPALAGTAEKESLRQLELARADIEAGHLERAVLSARSAIRLDPLRYEALLVLAEAYEELGDEDRARGLVIAWSELTGRPSPKATSVASATPAPRKARSRWR